MPKTLAKPAFETHPLTSDRWPDLEQLFGPRGGTSGCWCMWWRLTQSKWDSQRGEQNRKAFKAIVEGGETPGILAYSGGRPVGWCAIAPREVYPRLERSPTLARVDDKPVWSVTCFYIARSWRGKGVSEVLLKAAVAYARSRGARLVEGYPIDPPQGKRTYTWTGVASTFSKTGFVEVARRSKLRPIMRRAAK